MSETKKVYMSVGGVDTYIVFTFHHYDDNGNVQSVPVLFGSAISLSYSTYRNKKPVFNLGSHVMDGFAIGTRYVAGTLIKTMFLDDELADALKEINIQR
jgi:hypothetical protein